MQAFEAALRRKDADARFFFAPKSLRAGGYWLPELAKEIAEATAFVLLVGEKGVGPWQVDRILRGARSPREAARFPGRARAARRPAGAGAAVPAATALDRSPQTPASEKSLARWSCRRRPAAARRRASSGGTPRPIAALPP